MTCSATVPEPTKSFHLGGIGAEEPSRGRGEGYDAPFAAMTSAEASQDRYGSAMGAGHLDGQRCLELVPRLGGLD
jgi:hypothetical protein